MAKAVIIKLTTAGTSTGPFNLLSDYDSYVTPFETNIARTTLVTGYTSSLVPNTATTIRVLSSGSCTNYTDLLISGSVAYIATFTGDFTLCVDVTSIKDFRAQDASFTVGHFTTTSPITPNNCSGPVNVTGSLTPAQGPLKIAIPSVPGGFTAVIVANNVGAFNAATTASIVGGVLQVQITPNSYPSTVNLSGTVTVKYI